MCICLVVLFFNSWTMSQHNLSQHNLNLFYLLNIFIAAFEKIVKFDYGRCGNQPFDLFLHPFISPSNQLVVISTLWKCSRRNCFLLFFFIQRGCYPVSFISVCNLIVLSSIYCNIFLPFAITLFEQWIRCGCPLYICHFFFVVFLWNAHKLSYRRCNFTRFFFCVKSWEKNYFSFFVEMIFTRSLARSTRWRKKSKLFVVITIHVSY